MIKDLQNISYMLGAVLLLVSAVLVMEHVQYGNYLFAIGAALIILNKLSSQYRGTDFRLKRMNRYNLFSAIILVGCSYLQFHDNNSWVVLLLLVAILELFISLRISTHEKAIKAAMKETAPSEQQEQSDTSKPEKLR